MMFMNKLIINPVGGLANRMRAVAAGVSLSQELGMGMPEIVWPVNNDLFCDFNSLFESGLFDGHMENISSREDLLFYDLPRKKNLYLANFLQYGRYGLKLTDYDRLPLFEGKPESLENEIRSSHKPVLIRSGVVYYPFTKELYRSLFVPKKEFLDAAEERLHCGKNNIIGLHIRRTDNEISIIHSPLRLFIEAVEREMSDNKDVMFYLASDDAGVKAELRTRFDNRIIVSDKSTARNSAEGIKEALTEIVTLSRCGKVYGSYWSSFSEAAALLGDTTLIQLKVD